MPTPTLLDLAPGTSLSTDFPSHSTLGGKRPLACTLNILRLQTERPHWVVLARWNGGDGSTSAQIRGDLLDLGDEGDGEGKTMRLVIFEVRSSTVTPRHSDLLDQMLTELLPDLSALALAAGAENLQVVLEDTAFSIREHRHGDVAADEANRHAFVETLSTWECGESQDENRPAGQPRRFFAAEPLVTRWVAGPAVVPPGVTRH